MSHDHLKEQVKNYWNKQSCGTEVTHKKKYSHDYFEEIEDFRYTIEPEIFAFAQFTRFHGKKMLEIGVGAGTDFVQWARAGAHVYGIDVTQEAINNVQHRLELYNLKAADLCVADAEQLSYADNNFDLVYSWGVIHHSPNTKKCLEEIIRVTKPGGTIKVMLYNRYSLFALYRWILAAACKGKPFQSISHVLFHHQESPGTKAYTRKEVTAMLANYPVCIENISAPATNHDLLYYKSKPWRWLASAVAGIWGWQRCGWFMMITLKKM